MFRTFCKSPNDSEVIFKTQSFENILKPLVSIFKKSWDFLNTKNLQDFQSLKIYGIFK